MEVFVTCHERTLELFLKGELDHHGAKGVLQQLEMKIDENVPNRLVLDFTGVTFMDSSGIAVALRGWQRMRETEGAVTLRNVAPQPKKVFEAAGILRMIAME